MFFLYTCGFFHFRAELMIELHYEYVYNQSYIPLIFIELFICWIELA